MEKQSAKATEVEEGPSRKELERSKAGIEQEANRAIKSSNNANQSGSALLDIRPKVGDTSSEEDTGEQRSTSVASSSAVGPGGTKSSETSGKMSQDGSLPPKKPKKDRSNLRKGKWTVEEEEYTSRIIHYFSTGLLTLPEGSTLRSYLADKLNCDPMRITKKYAGASCLGRRVHQFRDRPTPTIAEIQLAKAELDHLEQRFRMRVEEGYSSLPVSPPSDVMFSLTQQANQFLMNSVGSQPIAPPSQGGLPTWLFGMNQQQPQAPLSAPGITHNSSNGLSEQAKSLSGLAGLGAALPWLLPNGTGNPSPQMPTQQSNHAMPNVDAAMASWAFAQAAASLAPAITQLAAANLQQQRQFQQAPKPAPVDPMKEFSTRLQESRDAESLRQALQAVMAGRNPVAAPSVATSSQTSAAPVVQKFHTNNGHRKQISNPHRQDPPAAAARQMSASAPPSQSLGTSGTGKRQRSEADKQDGNILLGFLSSLRQSYEEALKEKEHVDKTHSQQNNNYSQPTATLLHDAVRNLNQQQRSRLPQVSDTSSGVSSSTGQPESSLEESDWHSDKKTETSSSEDSDKEVSNISGKGPPRKRIKTKRAADERQREAAAKRKLVEGKLKTQTRK